MSELESAYAVIENAHGFDDPTSGVGWAWQVVLKDVEQTKEELAAVKAERDDNHQRAEEIIAAREKKIHRLQAERDALRLEIQYRQEVWDSIAKERDSLFADKVRLDAIESRHRCAMFNPKKGWAVSLNPFYRLQKFYPTLRAAIDAAMGGKHP